MKRKPSSAPTCLRMPAVACFVGAAVGFVLPSCRVGLAASKPSSTQPTYDWLVVDEHQQLYDWSCIPMSVEMVLKLEHREPSDYFELQNAWKNKRDGTFADFDGRTIDGLTFHRQFFLPRNDHFPMDNLFKAIGSRLRGDQAKGSQVKWNPTERQADVQRPGAAGAISS